MTSVGRRVASNIYEAIYTIIWVPIGLAILLLPFFGFITLLLWINGSGGSLNNACNPRTIQAEVLATIAPKTFWHEQVAHLQTEIQRKFFPPSELIRQASAEGREALRQAIGERKVPEVRTEAALLHQYAERLREKAEAIDMKASLGELGRNALDEYNASLERAQTCLQHSKSQLRRAVQGTS